MKVQTIISWMIISLIFAKIVQAAVFMSRGYPGETLESKIAFAESSEPIWYEVGSKPMPIEKIVGEVCGDQPNKFMKYLLLKSTELNGLRSIGLPIDPGSVVAIPFCHKLEREVRIHIRKDDNLYNIAKNNMGAAGMKTLASIVTLNDNTKKQPSREDIEKFSTSLTPGTSIILPYRTTERIFFPVTEDVEPRKIISEHPPIGFEMSAAYGTVESTQQSRPYQIETVGFVTSGSPVETDSCPAGGHKPGLAPFDVDLLRKRISDEIAYINSVGELPAAAVIGIIDNGLRDAENAFFLKKLFAINDAEDGKFSKKNQDDDGNKYIDDIFGSNIEDYDGRIATYGGDNSEHGTRIAALCLGGVNYIHALSQEEDPLVKIKIINFSSNLKSGLLSPHRFGEAVSYLASNSSPISHIINLSLSSSSNLLPIQNAITNHPNVLFIVAAGNNMTGGRNLSNENVYPACFSGNQIQASNIVTVASHTAKGEHANHSNYGNNVDLHAPGCAVNTIDIHEQVVSESGTSVATAIVSFTAGMMRALGGARMSPEVLKKRLLASSDIEPSLSDRNWSGARLNVVKAVSLTHDIIETNDSSLYLYTRFKNTDELRSLCADFQTRKNLNKILRVRPNLKSDEENKLEIEYWLDIESRISKVRCIQIDTERPIATLIGKEGEFKGPSLNSVKDIVIANLIAK